MSDIFSSQKRSDIMSKISGKNTNPEILVRKFLFSKGFRYRINVKTLPGKPDIVLPKYKTVIFINGLLLSGKTQITYKSLRNWLYIGNSAFFFEIQAP